MKLIPTEKFYSPPILQKSKLQKSKSRKSSAQQGSTSQPNQPDHNKSTQNKMVPTVVENSLKQIKKMAENLKTYANHPASFTEKQAHELLKNLKEKAYMGILHIEAQKKSSKKRKI